MGKRSQGGQKKRYKDTLKVSLNDFSISPESREQSAQDRVKWRCRFRMKQMTTKQRESARLNESAKSAKSRAESSSESSFLEMTCSICNRQFRANQPSANTPTHINWNTAL